MADRKLTLSYPAASGPLVDVSLGDDAGGAYISDYRISTRSPAQIVNLPRADSPARFDRFNDLTSIEWITDRTHASEAEACAFVDTHAHSVLRIGTFRSELDGAESIYLNAKIEDCECVLQRGLTTQYRYRLVAGLPT